MNTYSISLEGSAESLHKQDVVQEILHRGGKCINSALQNAKQIRDVPSFNKWGCSDEKPEEKSFSRQRLEWKSAVL